MSSIDTFYDDVVIDIPPGDGPDQRIALREADRIIVPMQPGIFDMWTVTLVDERVAEALEDRPDLKVWFVLNRVANHRGNIDSREARQAIETQCDTVPLADFDVHDRVSIRRASMSGRTVEEYEPVDGEPSRRWTSSIYSHSETEMEMMNLKRKPDSTVAQAPVPWLSAVATTRR